MVWYVRVHLICNLGSFKFIQFIHNNLKYVLSRTAKKSKKRFKYFS